MLIYVFSYPLRPEHGHTKRTGKYAFWAYKTRMLVMMIQPRWAPTPPPPPPNTLQSFLLLGTAAYDQLFMLSWGCPRGRPVQGPRKATGAHTSGTGCPCTLAVLSRTTAVSSAKILAQCTLCKYGVEYFELWKDGSVNLAKSFRFKKI